MSERIKGIVIYAAKCVAGTLSVFALASIFHHADVGWALISVMLVLSPDGRDAVPLAVTRIKANLAGAAVGAAFLLAGPPSMWTISAALPVSLAVGYALGLEAGIRSALAATIIVMLHEEGKHLWDTALARIASVLAGCLIGLFVTFLFHFKGGLRSEMKDTSAPEA